MVNIESIFDTARIRLASDIHLTEGLPVMLRVYGNLLSINTDSILTEKDIEAYFHILLAENIAKIDTYKKTRDIDFAYTDSQGDSYRINAYSKMGKPAMAIRRIERDAKSLEELILPPSIQKVLQVKQWLFLVTGPTGSGKSTTMVSLIEEINSSRSRLVIPIEDHNESIFTPKKRIFSQREVWSDTLSFVTAIRAAMREDPNIVMVGEMRDAETVDAALNLAETGHLVFSTLHTSGSVQTINRIVQFFEPHIQTQARMRLADSLFWVLSQRLIPRQDQPGRIAIRELMFVTPGIRNMIKTGDLKQMKSAIETGMQDGMISLEKSAQLLDARGIIKKPDYIGYIEGDEDLGSY